MEHLYVDLSEQVFILINGPLIFFIFTANIFYACCLIFPLHSRQRLKWPLRTLVEFLVWCSILYCVSLLLLHCAHRKFKSFEVIVVSWMIVLYFTYNSMTCYTWLNFYYYVQIVPAQQALSIWVKKHINSIISMAFLFDLMFFLFSCVLNIAELIYRSVTYLNNTTSEHHIDELSLAGYVCSFMITVHIMISLCLMTASSYSTVHYLRRHMRSVAQSGTCFSTPRIQSQMRVTITGIAQGVLFFLYETFNLFDSFTYIFSPHFSFSCWVTFTVTSLYISGTTVHLGIGQAVFRQRAADIWMALKALCGVGIVTNDVKQRSGKLASGEIVNTLTADVQVSL